MSTGQPMGAPTPTQSDEASEGRSWWKVCCLGCCLGVVALVVLVIIGLQFLNGPGPQTVKTLPSTYPKPLVYLPEEANQILYYPATSKSATSRIITGPLTWISETFGKSATTTGVAGAIGAQLGHVSSRDTVAIQWSNLSVSRQDVLAFYATALRSMGIYNAKTTEPNGTWDIRMVGSGTRLDFALEISDDPEKPGIEFMTVKAEYPVEAK